MILRIEKLIVLRVFIQPNLLKDIVGFVITLLIPASKIGAVIWMVDDVDLLRIADFAEQIANEA